MKKQGFTLIELMVVIVIMGILAAVAVPKLFGMIAKSKASEVGPAAGTYVKMAEAFFSEKNTYGTWELIGYTGPGQWSNSSSTYTTNFNYDGGALTSETTASQVGWQATSKVKLNECAANSVWTVTTKAIQSEGAADAYVSATPTGAGCPGLTPTFDKIGGATN